MHREFEVVPKGIFNRLQESRSLRPASITAETTEIIDDDGIDLVRMPGEHRDFLASGLHQRAMSRGAARKMPVKEHQGVHDLGTIQHRRQQL